MAYSYTKAQKYFTAELYLGWGVGEAKMVIQSIHVETLHALDLHIWNVFKRQIYSYYMRHVNDGCDKLR